MSRFKLKASKKGVYLLMSFSQGIQAFDTVKSATGLPGIGKSDFEAIEPFRDDRFFKQALNLH